MQTLTINQILENISSLPVEDQFFIADIINNRLKELRREQIALRAKEAKENYKNGNFTSGTVNDLMS